MYSHSDILDHKKNNMYMDHKNVFIYIGCITSAR